MADKEVKKSKAQDVDEDYEEPVQEDEDGEEDDFRARAKKNLKAKGGKPEKVVEKKAAKKAKPAKKAKGAGTSKGVARKDWNSPWRPSSILAQAFGLAQKKVSIKDLTALAKKNDVEPAYVIGAMKREKTRNWKWQASVTDTHIKITEAHASNVKAA